MWLKKVKKNILKFVVEGEYSEGSWYEIKVIFEVFFIFVFNNIIGGWNKLVREKYSIYMGVFCYVIVLLGVDLICLRMLSEVRLR